jgi:hypothetical protein
MSTGPSLSFVAASASGGDTFQNDGTQLLTFFIQDADPRTLTVHAPHAGMSDYEYVYAAPGGNSPRFDPLFWDHPKEGTVWFEFNNPIGVIIAVSRVNVIGIDPLAAPLPGLS